MGAIPEAVNGERYLEKIEFSLSRELFVSLFLSMPTGQYFLQELLNTEYCHQKFMDAIVSFLVFLIFPGTCCSSSTTNLLSLKASFTTSLASAAVALLPKHTGFNQVCWLSVPAQTRVNHTSPAKWSPGIHLQTALAEYSPQTLLLCKGNVRW